jgi:hypothetical protein
MVAANDNPPAWVGGKINNESELVVMLSRPITYRLLFATEAGLMDNITAGELLDLDANEFLWLRAVAIHRLNHTPPARQPRRLP